MNAELTIQATGRGVENPLLADLSIPTILQARDLLNHVPELRSDHFWPLPLGERLAALSEIDEIFYADIKEVELCQYLYNVVRIGAVPRDPRDLNNQKHFQQLASNLGQGRVSSLGQRNFHQKRVLIVGPRGAGTSAFVDRMVSTLGPTPRAFQLPGISTGKNSFVRVMKIQWPSPPSQEAICRAILAEIDSRYGSKFLEESLSRRVRLDQIALKCKLTATLINIGILFIDNIRVSVGEYEKVRNLIGFIENLTADTGIPVVLVGDLAAYECLREDTGILHSAGADRIEYFWAAGKGAAKSDFIDHVKTYWKFRVSHPAVPMPEWLPQTVFDLTQGLYKPITNLMSEIFRNMANRSSEELSSQRFRRIGVNVVGAQTATLKKLMEVPRKTARLRSGGVSLGSGGSQC